MISRVIFEELQGVGFAFVCGVFITVIYDLLRIFRRVIPHGNLWIGVEDLGFWIFTTFWSFFVIYQENDGNLRMYTILSMTAGMLFYHAALSGLLVGFFAAVFAKLWKSFLRPLKRVKISINNLQKKLKKKKESLIIEKIRKRSEKHLFWKGDPHGDENGKKKET